MSDVRSQHQIPQLFAVAGESDTPGCRPIFWRILCGFGPGCVLWNFTRWDGDMEILLSTAWIKLRSLLPKTELLY